MDKAPQRITLDLGEKEAEGIYANLAIISHSASEFIIDFARVMPGMAKSKVFARILMTPQNVKSLQRTLASNIERYEKTHGEIRVQGEAANGGIGFQTGD